MKLGDISDFINGGAWSDKAYVEEGYKVVKVTNMINGSVESRNDNFLSEESYKKYFKHKLYTSDLIIATVGSHPSQQGSVVGRTSIVPEDYNYALLNQNAVCIRITDERISQKFFNYLTKTIVFKHHIESRAQGSANQVRMALSELKKFSFCYPSLKTQQKIASLLSNYDKLIENNTQRITLLESMAEELYKEWFVRLRFPGHEEVEVVDGVPEGWERKSIFELSNVIYGYPLKSSLFNEKKVGIPLIRIRDIKNNFSKTYTDELVEDEKYFLKNGDLLVGMDGDFHMGIWSGGYAILNQRVVCFRPIDNLSKYFFYFAIKKDIEFLNKIISGTTVAHLSDKDLKKITLLIPNTSIMHKFKNVVDNIFKLRIELDIKNQTLKQTRDLLLPRLMSGKLNVEDLDII